MPDRHRVAQRYPLKNGGIFRLLPQRFKGDRECRSSYAERVSSKIARGPCPESVLCNGVSELEILREVFDQRLSPHKLGACDLKQNFRQRDHSFGSVLGCLDRIRKHIRVNISVVAVVFQLREVLSVLNHHAGIMTTALMMNDSPVVPLVFAAPEIQKGTCHTAEASSDALRLGNRERLCFGVFGLAGEIVRRRSFLKDPLHRQSR